MDFSGKNILIYGNGRSGVSAANAVKKRGAVAEIYSDKQDGEFDAPYGEYDLAIISPGIKPSHSVYAYCLEHAIPTMGEAELGFILKTQPVVAVTGTNGKTTTVRLITDMLGGTACGNIGYPISTAVDEAGNSTLVCELSSFQLAGAENIVPDVAVITNIAADHLNWHESVEHYYESKCNIAREMKSGSFLVLGEDIPIKALATLNTAANIVRCSSDRHVDGAYVEYGNFYFMGKRICPTDYLRLNGEHNIKNALCAIAASKCMGASDADIISALSTAEAAPHRLAVVGQAAGKKWIDDSKSTNISSCIAAVNATAGRICLITGGSDKGLDFSELFEGLDSRVVQVIAMGATAEDIKKSGEECGISVTAVKGLNEAVDAAISSNAEVVLLSPACASFDEFSDYAERGKKFCELVRSLGDRL